ncbi:MAG TPA: ClpXP protease specificity-enhancing factor SspB [Xanthobacteraceae bacterium]|nr:ClpXP protease specificity-enhancing factor SspB [Xanthobacteraceae bacterium]
MPVDHIRYDILAQEALRGVVRTVLADTAKNGLPGEHHFYISFDTRADGVRLSERMLAEYPEEMTIVLQHQFWDLAVTEEGFEVGMSFGGIPERVAVPFAAVKAFLDPSVEFGLRFQEIADGAGEGQEKGEKPDGQQDDRAAAGKDARPPAEHKAGRTASTLAAVPAPASADAKSTDKPTPDQGPDKPAGGGEVVRLDRFRKK